MLEVVQVTTYTKTFLVVEDEEDCRGPPYNSISFVVEVSGLTLWWRL